MYIQVLVKTLLSLNALACLASVSGLTQSQAVALEYPNASGIQASKDPTSDQAKSYLSGMVVDPTGAVVPNFSSVEIRAIAAGTSAPVDKTVPPRLTLQTGREGEFSAALAPGSYEVCVQRFPKSCRTVMLDDAKAIDNLVLRINPGEDHASAQLLDSRLRSIAGQQGKDCGHVQIKQDPRSATACALHAFQHLSPFYVRYDEAGFDSEVAHGFASDAKGSVFYVGFDSMGMDTNGLRPGVTMPDGFHTVVVTCSKPVRLRKTGKGELVCFSDGRWLDDDK